MEQYKKTLSGLQNDMVKVMQCLSRLLMSKSGSESVMEKQMDEYLCNLENLCVKSRTALEKFRPYKKSVIENSTLESAPVIPGDLDITHDGWLHISLATLLPSCKYRVTNYIGDTISRLIKNCGFELPYFETAFLAIVERCDFEHHNSLDNDNKGWKMIPNALKGSVIEDDSQFVLSIGLFSKISHDTRLDIYVMSPEDGTVFMDLLAQDLL